MQHAGVGEVAHARAHRGLDHGGVLGEALADLAAGDQQHPVSAGERLVEAVGLAVVGAADLDAGRGEASGLLRGAHGRDDLLGRDLGQQGVDHQAAELAGGSGNHDHRCSPVVL